MPDAQSLSTTFVGALTERTPHQSTFHQAVEEVARDVLTVEKRHADWATTRVLEQLTEPDRVISFRVSWADDSGDVQINRGWRVQQSNALGPYKGGLRFHPTVNEDVLKFLAFEQCFKNALTGLPLGGAKGGSNFDPTGRSDGEIMRFCQAFVAELVRYIGPDRDVPAGDINVGAREIGWLFGAYKKLAGVFEGALTGKGPTFGGSALRPEATGYGLIYFVEAMLEARGDALEGRRVAISGKGNVAIHAAEKAMKRGAKVVALSDTSGTLLAQDGMCAQSLDWVRSQAASGGDLTAPPALGLRHIAGALPWDSTDIDIALPCATQNEVDADAAKALVDAGISLLAEGANMPLTAEATRVLREAGIPHAPGKAANAGGVAVSGLEMSQNSHGQYLSADEVDTQLRRIMRRIHSTVVEDGKGGGALDYARGANVAAYRTLAKAITAQGIV